MAFDYLIVGAGIGGAVLANLLARAGKSVLVVERELATRPITRPEVLWPATVQLLESIVTREVLHDLAIMPLTAVEIYYKGARLARLSAEKARIQPWSSNPEQTRRLLLQAAPCEVKHGVEVVGLLKERERVVGVRGRIAGTTTECEIEARWTVGDDGGNSIIRRECGINMSISTLPVDLLSFGFQWPTSLQPHEARAWINPDRVRTGLFLMATLPRPAGIGAGLIAARPRLFGKECAIQTALDRFCAADRGAAEIIASRRYPHDLIRVKLRFGHADRYGVDGAVLIGDAAHTVTPAGGQGANSAIADARLLAQMVLGGESSLITAYERARRPANARALRLSRAASWMTSLPDLMLGLPIPCAFRSLSSFPGLFAGGLRFASTAFVENAAR